MGCATSNIVPDQDKVDEKHCDNVEINSSDTQGNLNQTSTSTHPSLTNTNPVLQLRATLLIQRWFRRWRAELEIRRRCTWTIFQTMEYASENEQLKLYNFFNEIISSLPEAFNTGQNGIDNEDSHEESYQMEIPIEAKYTGPALRFPLDVDQITNLIKSFKDKKILHARYLMLLLTEAKNHFKKIENTQYTNTSIAGKLTIVGDLHGSLDDLLMVFFKNGLPSHDNPYIINGDFVDRGKASVEVSAILFCLCLLYPHSILINRGNHEDYMMNKRYGFTTELVSKYGVHANKISKAFEQVFTMLPLITVIDNSVVVCHGGISDITDLEVINAIPRHKYVSLLRPPDYLCSNGDSEEIDFSPWRQLLDLLWSDPRAAPGCEHNSFRGGGTYFGPDTTDEFLEKHNFKLLIRSHECKPDGYDVTHDGKVVTVFSTSNYYDLGSNLGAYIRLTSNHKPQFIQFCATGQNSQMPLCSRIVKVECSALRDLRARIVANKGNLLPEFRKHDPQNTGFISLSEWASCLTSVLSLDLPWRTIRWKLVEINREGKIDYESSFTDAKLEASISNQQISEAIYRQRNVLETVFRLLDTDNSGFLSRDELRAGCQMLGKHSPAMQQLTPEDMEKIIDTMDIDKDGEINFNEFLESFRMVDSKFAGNSA